MAMVMIPMADLMTMTVMVAVVMLVRPLIAVVALVVLVTTMVVVVMLILIVVLALALIVSLTLISLRNCNRTCQNHQHKSGTHQMLHRGSSFAHRRHTPLALRARA
jgi:hypothetical protein